MAAIDLTDMLLGHGVKVTRQRLLVLECFGDGHHALTHPYIQQQIKNEMDRVSLYRILDLLTKMEVLLKLSDHQAITYYILNLYEPDNDRYFTLIKCQHCHKVEPIPEPPQSYVKLLKKHHVDSKILLNGYCQNCCHD